MNTAVIRLTNCHDCQYCDHNGMLQAHPKYICRNIEVYGRNTVNAKCVDDDPVNFKHHLQPFKVGVIVYDIEPIKTKLKEMFAKYSEDDKDKVIIKEKKVKAK